MKYLLLIISFLILAAFNPAFTQEHLSTLKTNDLLSRMAKKELVSGSRSIGEKRDTLCLPFLDDFSNPNFLVDSVNSFCSDTVYNIPSQVYPKSLLWLDKGAFINQTYPILPPTYGVATLDGLDYLGRPYNEILTYGPADTLTSKPIRLDSPMDSVYLSFYYQPGGYGDYPNADDSLVLDFLDKNSTWRTIWAVTDLNGSEFDPFYFTMLPVDTLFHHDAFQFRFRNYATRSGNNDHWHLDYVFLNEGRSYDDTLFRDVSFTDPPTSILKNYQNMPWVQFRDFQVEELADFHSFNIRNNFNTIINTTYQYEAFNGNDEIVPPTAEIAINFNPFSLFTADLSTFLIPESLPNYGNDSLKVTLKYTLNPGGDINRTNDTIRRVQDFYNYYSYDDGSAEKAYGLVGTNALLAMRYHANVPDTLRAVFIHWALIDERKDGKFFSLTVWDELDTTQASGDANIVYQEDFLTPAYVDSVNGFYAYFLDSLIEVSGDFYVGWRQTAADLLNVGFDVNNDASQNTYYNIGGNWIRSGLEGAAMIRPLVGDSYFKYTANPVSEPLVPQLVNVFPNPASETLFLSLPPDFGSGVYEIFDYTGRLVLKNRLSGNNSLDVSILTSGVYILRINDRNNQKIYTAKFTRL